jgi:transcriptional regulator with GAF, ATPase, and Fis domain
MSVRPLTDSPWQSNDCDGVVPQLKGISDTVGMACAGTQDTIEHLLDSARNWAHTTAWVVYRAGEQLHLVGQGDALEQWPSIVANDEFEAFCLTRRLHRWPTGRGECVLGWLLAPVDDAADPTLAEFAQRLGIEVQTNTLARAQITQRVLYEITYLASSTRDRSVFLVGVHRLLASLIDAENFYLALYDPHSGKIDYPYYVDIIDVDALESENYEYLDRSHLSLTGQVLTTGQPLLIDAAGILAAQAEGRFYCVGDRPEFWMGAPLKNASDEVFGMLAMQVYDVSRTYSAEDRALFLVVARHVAMALDRILHRADLEETVMRRTLELSALNDALRQEVADRERAEHLQSALFQIAELSSQPGDMAELFQTLHGIVGDLLFAQNFYIALFEDAIGEVTFPYYVDERQTTCPVARRGCRGLTEYVIRQRRPCLIDADEAERLSAHGEIELADESVRSYSWLGIPLFDGDVVRGVLAVQSYTSQVR